MIQINERELERINHYTVKPLEAEEVFCFSLLLCDNEIDRDFERFDVPALHSLASLFKGKTGIFDHNPKAGHQTARIYDTEVVGEPGRKTQAGEDYYGLKARAYMLRTEKNRDLIREIEGGIKKEVSVGCAVERRLCSFCGKDSCGHVPGTFHEERLVHRILSGPTDAYEWSFVAIPAQRGAGVTKGKKRFYPDGENEGNGGEYLDLMKKLSGPGETWQPEEMAQAKAYVEQLEKEAAYGRTWHRELVREVVKLGYLCHRNLEGKTLERIAMKLDVEELKALKQAFGQGKEQIVPQLAGTEIREDGGNDMFQI